MRVLEALLQTVAKQNQAGNSNNTNSNDAQMAGVKQVKGYLKENGPYEVFDMFDNDKDDGLNMEELNNLFT